LSEGTKGEVRRRETIGGKKMNGRLEIVKKEGPLVNQRDGKRWGREEASRRQLTRGPIMGNPGKKLPPRKKTGIRAASEKKKKSESPGTRGVQGGGVWGDIMQGKKPAEGTPKKSRRGGITDVSAWESSQKKKAKVRKGRKGRLGGRYLPTRGAIIESLTKRKK